MTITDQVLACALLHPGATAELIANELPHVKIRSTYSALSRLQRQGKLSPAPCRPSRAPTGSSLPTSSPARSPASRIHTHSSNRASHSRIRMRRWG